MSIKSKKSQPKRPNLIASPLLQPEENELTVCYLPFDGEQVGENPPRFQWIPPQMGHRLYEVEVQPFDTNGNPIGGPKLFSGIQFPFFTPDEIFTAGNYRWRYRCNDNASDTSEWSVARLFTVKEEAHPCPFSIDHQNVANQRPRLLISDDPLNQSAEAIKKLPVWSEFFKLSVEPWMDRNLPSEPLPYPDGKRVPALWRKSYITCQEALYAIRNLAIAGKITKNKLLTERAKDWLLTISRWDPDGPTSRAYNDESAFRLATALAWGYDWLRDELSDQEAAGIRAVLKDRGRQVANHVLRASRIDTFPYDSHAVRSVSAVLVPVGLALMGEDEEADLWFQYASSYLAGPYSAWGDECGGWAEGMHYWTTGMCYALEAAVLLRNVSGFDLFKRPFFKQTGNFPLFCRPAWTRRGTFGDDSTLGDAPSPKIGKNMRLLGAATSTPLFAGYADQIEAKSDSDEMAFYNYGWWDFRFDDLLREASFGNIESAEMPAGPKLKTFPKIGWASLQVNMNDPAQQLHCVFKSSPFGSISHSHADQNAFCISGFGDDIFVQSGHYVAHNSSMHRQWRRQTISKNALLIDKQGQYADDDKLQARKSGGNIVGFGEESKDHLWVKGDATKAYQNSVPSLQNSEREIHLLFGSTFLVIDHVTSSEPLGITWLGHSMGDVKINDISATITTENAVTGLEVAYSSAPISSMSIKEGFDHVKDEDWAGLDTSRRVEIEFEPAKTHVVATMISPVKTGENPKVMTFVEDQGFGKTLYCLCKGRAPIRIPL